MAHTAPILALLPLSRNVEARIRRLEELGRETCVLTWEEFEALKELRTVTDETVDIFRDLGVLGYTGNLTLFHAKSWTGEPLRYRDYDSRA